MTPSRHRRRPSSDELIDQGARLLRSATLAPPGVKARDLHEVARLIVELRERCTTEDGRADWSGRSGPYREAVARMYDESGVQGDDLSRLKSTIRYHVGNLVREVAPAEELEDLGLQSRRPLDRARDLRTRLSAQARAGALADGAKKTDPLRMIVGADVNLSHVTQKGLDGMEDGLVEDAVASLESIAAKSAELLDALEPRRVKRRGGIRRRASG